MSESESPFAGVPRKPLSDLPVSEELNPAIDEMEEVEVVELQDDAGNKQEFAILKELEFEGRKVVIMLPFEDLSKPEEVSEVLVFEISSEDEDLFKPVEDEEYLMRLTSHLAGE
jgi:uncharacterized protein YrzB (UPF0473 family)